MCQRNTGNYSTKRCCVERKESVCGIGVTRYAPTISFGQKIESRETRVQESGAQQQKKKFHHGENGEGVGATLKNNPLVAHAARDALLVKIFKQRNGVFAGDADASL